MNEHVSYEQRLAAEAELWGTESQQRAQAMPPDWRYHRLLRHNVIMHGKNIEQEHLEMITLVSQTLTLTSSSKYLHSHQELEDMWNTVKSEASKAIKGNKGSFRKEVEN